MVFKFDWYIFNMCVDDWQRNQEYVSSLLSKGDEQHQNNNFINHDGYSRQSDMENNNNNDPSNSYSATTKLYEISSQVTQTFDYYVIESGKTVLQSIAKTVSWSAFKIISLFGAR